MSLEKWPGCFKQKERTDQTWSWNTSVWCYPLLWQWSKWHYGAQVNFPAWRAGWKAAPFDTHHSLLPWCTLMSRAKWVFLFQLETSCENRRSRGHWHTFSVTMCICATWKLLCTSYWAGELCAPGSLAPVVPLQEYDKKQQKTNVLMWLQVRIFSVSVNASLWASTSQDESFMNLGLFLIWQNRCQPTKTRDLKSLFVFECQFVSHTICISYSLWQWKIYSKAIKEN